MYALTEGEELHKKIIATTRGVEVGVYHREPTTEEIHRYNNEAIRRKGQKMTFRQTEAQYKFGAKILKGLVEGAFGVPGPDGKLTPVSSDPESPDYKENWKQLVLKRAPAVVITLGAAIFGGTEAIDEAEDVDGEDEDKDIDGEDEDKGEDVTKN